MPRLDAWPDITDEDIMAALKRPSDFGYHGDLPLFTEWSLGDVIRHRDSTMLEESNAAALVKHLESDSTLDDDWAIVGANHWVVGWVDHLAFKVLEDGAPSRIFRVLRAWFDALSDYPVADDEDLSAREYAAGIALIGDAVTVADDAPEDWADAVWSWLWEHDQGALEDIEHRSPTREQVTEACESLGIGVDNGN